ncbi:carbohydrate ABC transporter permease [Streptomyces sp. NPDC004752]
MQTEHLTVPAAVTATEPGRRLKKPHTAVRGRRGVPAGVLVVPAVAFLGVFVVLPTVLALISSLFEIRLGSENQATWVGLRNYQKIFDDPVVIQSFGNTALYCAMTIVPSIALGLGLALLANTIRRFRVLVEALLFLPFTANLVAMAVVFRYVFDLRGGFVNQLMAMIGLAPLNFLGDTHLALPTLAAIGVWRGSSLAMLMYLAGLTTIPTAIAESATVDGITGLRRLRWVTLPLLRPVTLFVAVLMTLQSVQVFDTVNVLTQGGPLNSTQTVLTEIWQLGFSYYDLGQGAALSAVLLIILVIIGAVRRSAFTKSER